MCRPFITILKTNPNPNSFDKAFGDNVLTVIGKAKYQDLVLFKADLPKV